MKGYLALEDGTVFEGEAFGAAAQALGEVVFNTGMTGYQEILTDPSYCGQIVTMTYPLIGNYGINREDFESARPRVKGFVVKELCDQPSHWQTHKTLSQYLYENGIVGIAGIDTRALTRHLRTSGTMRGVIAGSVSVDRDELVERARQVSAEHLVDEASTPVPYRVFGTGPRVVVVDFGVKANILRCLREADCDLVVVPARTEISDILNLRPSGILLSNGPGDPKDVPEAIRTVSRLLERPDLPVFGICLGHQILALAMGGDTYKLKYGHRGANHPVKDLQTGRVFITSQNHGYAIDDTSLDSGQVEVTHRNLNDGTVEGMRLKGQPVFSVQYHPEAAPGPEDSRYLFEQFLEVIRQ